MNKLKGDGLLVMIQVFHCTNTREYIQMFPLVGRNSSSTRPAYKIVVYILVNCTIKLTYRIKMENLKKTHTYFFEKMRIGDNMTFINSLLICVYFIT